MVIAIDFDGCVVAPNAWDAVTPLKLRKDARWAIEALRRAGHVLLLYSARANLASRTDQDLDPLVRSGAMPRLSDALWQEYRIVAEARYQQMLAFVAAEMPGLFDAIDDGRQGKPVADLYLDDRALRVARSGMSWREVAELHGDPTMMRSGTNGLRA